MNIQINASYRLRAMAISPGDNFKDASQTVEDLLTDNDFDWEILQRKGNQILATRPHRNFVDYALLQVAPTFTKFSPRQSLRNSGVETIEALGIINKDGEVNVTWVSPKYRGLGYGKALYQIMYQESRRGIFSSDNLGTMSLGVWISLYRSHPEIQIEGHQLGVVPRSEVTITGLEIKVNGEKYPLTHKRGERFIFRWPK